MDCGLPRTVVDRAYMPPLLSSRRRVPLRHRRADHCPRPRPPGTTSRGAFARAGARRSGGTAAGRATELDGVGEAEGGAQPEEDVVQPQEAESAVCEFRANGLLELGEGFPVGGQLAVNHRLRSAVALADVGEELPAG